MKLGSYDLLEKIGKGGMATVYKGTHRDTGEVAAIKVMKIDKDTQSVVFRRFEKEFQAASRLDHPNIVRVLDFGWENGRAFLAMEFVEGQNLAQLLRQRERLPTREAIDLILQVAEALEFAHDHQLIHRDVKPENILTTDDGLAKLADFGLIKDQAEQDNLTKTHTCLGTLPFMAPEQYEDAKTVDPRCDVYGLAGTLYFLLTGEVPFPGSGGLTVLDKKLKNDFPPPSQLVPGLNPQFDSLMRLSLDADRNRRTSSCQEFIRALRAIAASEKETRKTAPGKNAKPIASDTNRRIARRYKLEREGKCWVGPNIGQRWNACIENISITGLRVKLARRFEPGTLIALEVCKGDDGPVSHLWMQVRWARPDQDSSWILGCAFHSSLAEEELEDLLDSHSTNILVPHAASLMK
jgi:serine/threonine protein kinase